MEGDDRPATSRQTLILVDAGYLLTVLRTDQQCARLDDLDLPNRQILCGSDSERSSPGPMAGVGTLVLRTPVCNTRCRSGVNDRRQNIDSGGNQVAEDIAAAVGAVAAIGTLIVAIKAAIYAKGQLDSAAAAVKEAAKQREAADRQHVQQLEHEERIREEESQPYVVVFTRLLQVRGLTLIELVVKNFGQTAALDVRFAWDQPLQQSFHGAIEDIALPERIALLPPGQEYTTLWDDVGRRRESAIKDQTTNRVKITYRRRPGEECQTQECIVDLAQYEAMQWVEIYTVHDLTKEIEKLRKSFDEFRKLPVQVHGWDGAEQLELRQEREAERMRQWKSRQEQQAGQRANGQAEPEG